MPVNHFFLKSRSKKWNIVFNLIYLWILWKYLFSIFANYNHNISNFSHTSNFEYHINLVNFKCISYLSFIKVFQILYSTCHKLNGPPNFFMIKFKTKFEFTFCVHVRIFFIFKLNFAKKIFVYFIMHNIS